MPRKRVTSQDVAELAGVSRTTVSFVLNDVPGVKISEETRQRVLEAASQLDYYPASAARSLASGRTNAIGLVLCQSPNSIFADAFLPEVIHGLGEMAQGRGFRILLQSVEDVTHPEAYIDLVREKYIDGLIVSGPRYDDAQLLQLAQEGFPIVLLGQLNDASFSFVDVDNVGAARMATEHLIALGHRRIGLITNAPPQYTASRDRLRGYRLALEAYGLPYDDNLVRYGNFREESGYEAMTQVLALAEQPTAMFVACDLVAFGAMEAIKEQGLAIPGDIAVVGFDDVRLANYVDPPLTTVHLPAYEQGQRAADLLIRLINREEIEETQVLLETKLVIRESCGAKLQSASS
jgi:DNA-binding LacI/PurR family transcriptional regulator